MITKVEGRWTNAHGIGDDSNDYVELEKGFMPEIYDETTLFDAMREDKQALSDAQFETTASYKYRVTRDDSTVVEYDVRDQ